MIDKKDAKAAYKNAEKVGAVIAYHNLDKDKLFLDIAPDLAGAKHRFEFSKKVGIGLPLQIQADAKSDRFELEILEELKKNDQQTDKDFKIDLLLLKDLWLEKLADQDLY